MDYLLKASAILTIFYLFYKFILQGETFFQSNRFFLLIGLIASITIPLIVIPIYIEQTIPVIQKYISVDNSNVNTIQKSFDWIQLSLFGYLGGVAFFTIKFSLSIGSLVRLFIKSDKEKISRFYLIKSEAKTSPFSFFNYIVYNPKLFKQHELKQVLVHEKVHAYQWHSFDVLLSQITTIMFWFNPISWLYKKELQQNLEFIADAVSQEKSSCKKSYQQLLLKTSISKNQLVLTNNFYNSLIKKRIIMLHKNKSNNTNQWKFALILPLIVAFVFTFNTKTIAQTVAKKVTVVDETDESHQREVYEDKDIYIINKDTKSFDSAIKLMALRGVTLKFKNVKRNNNGEIISLKIEAKSAATSANFNTKNTTPINPIKIEVSDSGNNISIGNTKMIDNNKMIFVSTDSKHNVKTSESYNIEFIPDNEINTSSEEKQTVVYILNDFEDSKTDTIKIDKENIYTYKVGINEIAWTDDDNNTMVKIIKNDGDGKKTSKIIVFADNEDDPKIIVNGKKFSKEELEKMSADNIKNIEVIKIDASEKKSQNAVNILKKGDTKISYKVDKIEYFPIKEDKSPLYIVDGKEINKADMEKINPDDIEKINVLKGESAIKLYGKKGKEGVIEITTKKK